MSKKLKTLNLKDVVTINFGEWFDKANGSTYYDAVVYVNNECWQVSCQYGYNAGDNQSIDEALKACGYKMKEFKSDHFKAYRKVNTLVFQKKKRELFKTTEKIH